MLPRLLLVTDRLRARLPLPEAVGRALSALPPGGAAVLLREKDLEAKELVVLARALRGLAAERGDLLLVSGRFDVALAVGADGVHLGGEAPALEDVRAIVGNRLKIGVSLHRDETAPAGADYSLLAPVFATASKPGVAPLGTETLRRCAAASAAPVFALGGVDSTNAAACLSAGAHGIAVRGAVLGAEDPGAAAERLWAALAGERAPG